MDEIRTGEVMSTAEVAECTCPDSCDVDHDNG
jgi:hypothetical protein